MSSISALEPKPVLEFRPSVVASSASAFASGAEGAEAYDAAISAAAAGDCAGIPAHLGRNFHEVALFVRNAGAPYWQAMRADAQFLILGRSLADAPLWLGAEDPTKYKREPDGDEVQEFFLDWYDGVLAGQNNWPLLRDIAQIDLKVWEGDSQTLAGEISRRVEKHDLLGEISALKAERERLVVEHALLLHRSHNRPPELVDAPAEIAERTILIWDLIDEAETELLKTEPDLSRLQQIARSILEGCQHAAAFLSEKGLQAGVYLVAKGDEFLSAAATSAGSEAGKNFIRYGVPIAADHYLNGGRIMELAHRLLHFAAGG